MKPVARSRYPEKETSGDVEFTDRESVEAIAEEFAAFVDARTGEGVETGR